MSSTTRPNGLALILFNDPKEPRPIQTKGGTRSMKESELAPPPAPLKDTSEEVNKFEVFLHHCTFVLESPDGRTVVHLDATVHSTRQTDSVLPNVDTALDWKVVLSRYRYTVNPVDAPVLMTKQFWILKLAAIERTPDFPYVQKSGKEYITSVACFPQAWLPWISNEWFHNNVQKNWFMQDADKFGIPSVQSTRKNDYSDPEDERYHFRLFNVPNTATTAIDQGETEVGVSEMRLFAGFTDSTQGIPFPSAGVMYVILFDMPTQYQIARKEIADKRECVLCGDARPHVDLGVVFGKCGHYLCHDCCKEYKKNINATTTCYYCRDPTAINLDTLAESDEDDTDQGEPLSKKSRSGPELSPGTQLKCMFSLLQKL
jgi:hypothetical protein